MRPTAKCRQVTGPDPPNPDGDFGAKLS